MNKIILIISMLFLVSSCNNLKKQQPISKNKSFDITHVTFLGSIWNDAFNQAHVVSQDGGSEFKVPDGSIWCFGDTFKGNRDKNGKPHFKGKAVNCTLALLSNESKPYPPDLKYLTGKDGTAVSPFSYLGSETAEKNSIWPLAGIYLNGKSYLYYTLIEKTGTGSWDFKHTGDGLAVSEKPLSHYKRITINKTWNFPVRPSAIIEKNGWLYLYSIEDIRKNLQGVFLSRVKPENIENPDLYEYFCDFDKFNNKPLFSKNKASQKVLLNKIYGQTSVVWNQYLKKYLLASASSFFEPRSIKFFSSETPYGPWSNTEIKIQIPKIRQNKEVELTYCAFFHPSLFRENGRIMYLTYSLLLKNSAFDTNCEMIKVELKK